MDVESKRNLAKKLKEAAKKLEAEADSEGALKAAAVPPSFPDFASFFQSEHFQWELTDIKDDEGDLYYWSLKGEACSDVARQTIELLVAEPPSETFDAIRADTGTYDFYRSSHTLDSKAAPFIYFKISTRLNGVKKLLEKMPDLSLVISSEEKQYLKQELVAAQEASAKEYRATKASLEANSDVLNGISIRLSSDNILDMLPPLWDACDWGAVKARTISPPQRIFLEDRSLQSRDSDIYIYVWQEPSSPVRWCWSRNRDDMYNLVTAATNVIAVYRHVGNGKAEFAQLGPEL